MKTIKAAAVQMDVKPAPVEERLERANKLVMEAAHAGAELIVLPEVFNTGYAYSDANYDNAESFDGPTITWMKKQAAELGIHLAGSLLLKETRNGQTDIWNALFLFAPNSKFWRYDKNYPWSWEYAYSVPAENRPKTVIAQTDLGDIGFLICWDVAHGNLWQAYAGKVDLMVICSSPPDACDASLIFPNGEVRLADTGKAMQSMKDEGSNVFLRTVKEQLGWLGVPGVSAMFSGTFETRLPRGTGTLLMYALSAPSLFKYLGQAKEMLMRCLMVPACQIVNASGEIAIAADFAATESFIVSNIQISDKRPQPQSPQPAPVVRSSSFFLSDSYIPLITRSLYRKATKGFQL